MDRRLTLIINNDVFMGGKLSFVSASQVSIGTAGEDSRIGDLASEFTIEFNVLLTADMAVVGANGRSTDADPEPADAHLGVYVIADMSGVNLPAALVSASMTSPALPAGFDSFRLLGRVRNRGGDLIDFRQFGTGRKRLISYRSLQSTRIIVDGGASTTKVLIDASEFVPPGVRSCLTIARNNGTNFILLYEDTPVESLTLNGIAPAGEQQLCQALRSDQQYAYTYQAAGGSTQQWVIEYEDEL